MYCSYMHIRCPLARMHGDSREAVIVSLRKSQNHAACPLQKKLFKVFWFCNLVKKVMTYTLVLLTISLNVKWYMCYFWNAFYLVNFLVDNWFSLCHDAAFLILLLYFVLVIFNCWQLRVLFKLLHYFSNCTVLVSIAAEC